MKTPTVIMGAGIAGMAAAKMLAAEGRRVLLADRSFGPVAQSGHLHVLLSRGQGLLERHFPEVYREIAERCPRVNWGEETYWRSPAGALPRRPVDISTHLMSRAYIDRLLLDDLRRTPGCELVEGKVGNLCFSADGGRVEAVELGGERVECEICIDCLGRGSRTARRLESEFAEAVISQEHKTALRYFTYHARPKTEGEYRQVYFQIDPQRERYGGVISPIEGGRLIATFISVDREFEPEGNPFRLIEDTVFQDFVERIEFEPGHQSFGQLHNRLHRYGRYRKLPANLFLLGDSVCQFNPVFGQGMTVALGAAELLRDFLRSTGRLSLEFQREVHKQLKFPWAISTMDPYDPGTGSSTRQRLTRSLIYRVIRNSHSKPQTHQSLVEVLHMQRSPRSLFRLRHLF